MTDSHPRASLRVAAPLLAAALAALPLAGCDRSSNAGTETPSAAAATPQPASAKDADVVATVNGRVISTDMFNYYLQQKQASGPHGADPLSVLNELINIELLTEVALVAGLDKRPDVRLELERQRKSLLANLALRERMSQFEIGEAELEAEYEKQVAATDRTQYRASHILVKGEEEAKALIRQLDEGADFAALAEEHSVGPSGKKGGDLGWFAPGDMVPEFAAAVKALKPGSYTNVPVMTQFGWHVIKAVDSREVEPPAFEDVEEQLRTALMTRKVATYLQELRERAEIDVKVK